MGSLNPTAENVEIDLQTPTISDLLPETTTPAKQAGKSVRAKASTPAPAPKPDLPGASVNGHNYIARLVEEVQQVSHKPCLSYRPRRDITHLINIGLHRNATLVTPKQVPIAVQ